MKRYVVGLLSVMMLLMCHAIAEGSLWSVVIDAPNGASALSVQQTADSSFIMAGYTGSFGAGGEDAWVLKLNADGSVAWQKTYGGSDDEWAFSVQQTADGGHVVAGLTYSFGVGSPDAWILKLNADGSVAWQKTYGGSGWDDFSSVQQTADGGFIVSGSRDAFGMGGRGNAWLLKLNADGSMAWQKIYRGILEFTSVQQTADGGYVVAGGDWVLKLDQNGGISGCAAVRITNSSAVASDTSVVPADSNARVASTSVSPVATAVVPIASGAKATINCFCQPTPTACSSILSDDFKLHIPVVDFQGSAYWADFQYVPNTIDFVLTNAGLVVDDTSFRECAHSVLSNDVKFLLPDIIFAGKSYWAQLTYKEGATVTLTRAGGN